MFIQYRGVCTQAPCYCIIMEYCAQGQLYEVLRAGRKVTPRLLVDWASGIASGMNYLHLHKIIHRDLKSPKWVSWIAGIVKREYVLTDSHSVLFKSHYYVLCSYENNHPLVEFKTHWSWCLLLIHGNNNVYYFFFTVLYFCTAPMGCGHVLKSDL